MGGRSLTLSKVVTRILNWHPLITIPMVGTKTVLASSVGQMMDKRSRQRRWIKRFIKPTIFLVVVTALIFSGRHARDQWQEQVRRQNDEIARIDRQISRSGQSAKVSVLITQRDNLQRTVPSLKNLNWKYLGLSAVLYGIGLLPSGLLLRSALQSLGQQVRISTALAAQLLGHVGKYVPGKALVVLLRAKALSRDDIPMLTASLCVFVETFMMMAVGATFATVIVIWLPVPIWIVNLAAFTALLAIAPTLPPILNRVVKKLASRKQSLNKEKAPSVRLSADAEDPNRYQPSPCETRVEMTWTFFTWGWLWSTLTWVFLGLSFMFVVLAIPTAATIPDPPQLFAICTAAISLAVVVGFASLLPGGAGVRELVLATILGIAITASHGLMAAIIMRAIHLLVEACLGLFSWRVLRNLDET